MDNFYKFGTIGLIALFGFWFFSQSSGRASATPTANNLTKVENGKQIVNMAASYSGYSPNRFTLKVGVPVVWNITATDNAGCASALTATSLFPEMISLSPGVTTTKEFTPTATGVYRFSCAMGMYTGSFEVIN